MPIGRNPRVRWVAATRRAAIGPYVTVGPSFPGAWLNIWEAGINATRLDDSRGTDHLQLGSTSGVDTNDPAHSARLRSFRYVTDDWAEGAVTTQSRGPFTWCTLLRVNDSDITTRYFSGYNGLHMQQAVVHYAADDKKWRLYNGVNGPLEPVAAHKFTLGAWTLLTVVSNGTDWQCIVDKGDVHSAALLGWGITPDDLTPRASVGSGDAVAGGALDSDIPVVARTNRAISYSPFAGSELETIYNTLRARWPLP